VTQDIRLVLLDDAEYADFAERQVVELARQSICAGEWTEEEAPGRARGALSSLLSDRLRADGHVFLGGDRAGGNRVGWIWVAPPPTFLADDSDGMRWLS
jgi:hypothetical protein